MSKLDPRELRTRYAQDATDLASRFGIRFSALRLGGRYRPELAAPEGQSTAGGVQASMPLRLVPDDGGAPLLIGHANPKTASAELRSVAQITSTHRERFGGELPIPAEEIERFFALLASFFTGEGMTLVEPPPSSVAASAAAPSEEASAPKRNFAILGLVLAVILALGGILALAVTGKH
jgi:hypothetical protein